MKTEKIFIILILLFVMSTEGFSQGRVLMSQYFQNMPAFSPAFTGANNYLDIRTGFRKQWAGFDGSPGTGFISAYSPIRIKKNPYRLNSLRTSSTDQYLPLEERNSIRLGLGGYILLDEQGPFRELESMLSFAVHVPVSENTFLSLGLSAGLLNDRVEISEITVNDVNDQTYQSYLNDGNTNSFLNINSGIGIYSDRYYLSYSAMQLTRSFISGNDNVNKESEGIRHHILGGVRLFLNQHWEMIPNTFLRIESNQPFFYEVGARARYNQNFWFGASYRNDQTIVGMLGVNFNDTFTFGYAYDYKSSDFDNFSSGSHEFTLGLRLFNFNNYTSIW